MTYLLLFRTRLLDHVPMNHGLSADLLRRHYWVLLAVMAVPAAAIGWSAGPVLSEFF